MNVKRVVEAIICKKFLSLFAVVLAVALPLIAQTQPRANRIPQDLAPGAVTTLAGTLHPLTLRATDLGAVDARMQLDSMTLNISLSAAQQAELNALLEAQQDPKSPQYHQWLTQEAFGARFGLTDDDLSKVTAWLAAEGFTVQSVSDSRNAITFRGSVLQVEAAFHTPLHQYQLDGETHFANATELRIPASLAGVVRNVRGLNDFRPKANIIRTIKTPSPEFTTPGGSHFMAPGDWATIYDVTSIYNAGFTGVGAHVGIVGQTYAPKADIDHFRSAAGLTSTKLNYHCISSSNCTSAAGTSTDGDLLEADLDIEWAGGIAENATVDFIYSAHGDTSHNVFDALQYAIQTYKVSGAVVPVLSMSYESCEQDVSASEASFFLNLAQQANAQGQTIVVSSGDSGAAGCDAHGSASSPIATVGISAGVPADVPNITAVGGTTFSGDQINPYIYWNSSSSSVNTALQYIPETVWNDTDGNGLAASGGAVSTLFPQPAWQWTPADYSGASGRFVPDVAFAASPHHDGYLTCSQVDNSSTYGTSCTSGFVSSANYLFLGGGTSAGTPSFAGMLTLLTQKYGPLGNINPVLYSLASNPTNYASVFHDITTGNNFVPCSSTATGCVNGQLGYLATAGYDLTTGLGSIDGGALYTALATALKLSATSTVVTAAPNSVAMGATTTLTAVVSSTKTGTITGTVTFAAGSTNLGSATVSNGTAVLTGVQVTPTNGFTAGTTALITASYSGDTTFAASGSSTTMTLAALPTTTTTLTATPTSMIINSPVTLNVAVTSTVAGSINGTVTFKIGTTAIGTAPLSNGSATLSSVSTSAANGFSVGGDTITATYGGDPMSYGASSGTTILTVLPLPATTTTVSASPSSLTAGGSTTLTATVTSTGAGTPSGTITFKTTAFNSLLGTAPLSNGTATLSITANSANYLPPGTNSITAMYSGDTSFAASSGTTSLQVTAIPVTTTVTVAPASVMLNNPANFTITLTAPGSVQPFGYVTLKTSSGLVFDNRYVSGGSSTMTDTVSTQNGFTVGADTITASFAQNSDFGASNGTAILNVLPQPVTTTSVTVNPSAVTVGSTTTLSASVTSTAAGTPTGTITFLGSGGFIAYAPLTNGTATLSNVTVNAANGFIGGPDAITARYSGDLNFASSSGTATLTVNAFPSTTAITVTPASVTAGGNATFNVSVSGSGTYTPSGAVNFTLGGTTLGSANLVSGKATSTWLVSSTTGFAAGANTIVANYVGDGNFNASSASTMLTMVPTYSASNAIPAYVGPGGTTTSTFTLKSDGYAGTVSFVATANSSEITASAAPVILTAGGTANATVIISASKNAANHVPGLPWKTGGALVFCAVLLGAPFSARRKPIMTVLLAAAAILAAGFLISCGGGGSGSSGPSQPRNYSITVTPTGSGVVTNAPGVTVSLVVQ
jgi:subtilase family serine protease